MKLLTRMAQRSIIWYDQIIPMEQAIPQMGKITVNKYNNKKMEQTIIDKGEMYVLIQYIKDTFEKEAQVCDRFLQLLPEMSRMDINDEEKKMKFHTIWCKMKDGDVKSIYIHKTHKIILALIEEIY